MLVFLPEAKASLNPVDSALQPVQLVVQSLNLPFKAVYLAASWITAARISSTGESAASAWKAGKRDVQALSLLTIIHFRSSPHSLV
jgi:hypothetical protein